MFGGHGGFAVNAAQQHGQAQNNGNAGSAGGAGEMNLANMMQNQGGAGMQFNNIQQMLAMNGLAGMQPSQQQQGNAAMMSGMSAMGAGGSSGMNGVGGTGVGAQPSQNFNASMAGFNPQMQALLQQQLQQRQQQVPNAQGGMTPNMLFPQFQQQQQQALQGQNMMGQQQTGRWPGQMADQSANLQQLLMAGAQNQQRGPQGMMPGQTFNPFAQQQQQSQQPGMHQNTNFLANAMQQQQQQQQQQQNSQSSQQNNMNMDAASLMAAAAQAMGGNGMVDPNVLLQNAGLLANLQGFNGGSGQSMPNMNNLMAQAMQQQLLQHQQQQMGNAGAGMMRAPTPAQGVQQSPKAGKTSANATPETKAKPRGRGSAKKKKADEQQAAEQAHRQHSFHASSSAQTAPSPAMSMFQTPTQAHASIPAPSPAGLTFAQQQERARSQTRSPSVSMPTHGMPQMVPPPIGASSSNANIAGPSNGQSAPIGWTPSLNAQQQQQLLQQALSYSKAQSNRPPAVNGQAQPPTPSPAQTLMKMGYVYVKANVLPNNGFGAGIPGNGPSGAGAVLSIDEAKTVGIFGPQQQQLLMQTQNQLGPVPGPLPGIGHVPPQPSQQAQQSPAGMSGMQPQGPMAGRLMQQAHMALNRPSAAMQAMGQANNAMFQQQQTATSMLPPGTGPQHAFQQLPSHLLQPSQRGSPHGSNGSPFMASPMQAHADSPSIKGARARQHSTSSRPASSAGRVANHEAQMAAASYATYGQPAIGTSAGQVPTPFANNMPQALPELNAGNMSAIQGFRPGGPSLDPNLPPVNGGPLPKKTKLGFDIAPEYNARLTPLPDSGALSPGGTRRPLAEAWKPLTDEEQQELIGIMRRDNEYTKLLNTNSQRMMTHLGKRMGLLRPVGRLHWWERGLDDDQRSAVMARDRGFENFKILLPADKRAQRAALAHKGSSTAVNILSSRQMKEESRRAATLKEDLVPIRLEIDHEGWKLRDAFTWPAPECDKADLMDRFAVMLCDDIGLPVVHFAQGIREAISSQVQEHVVADSVRIASPNKRKRDESLAGRGRLNDKEARWWKGWREAVESLEQEGGSIREIDDDYEDKDEQMTIEANERRSSDVSLQTDKEADLRIHIRLDITVGAMNLIDQFEWDVNDEGNSAEDFAAAFAADLGLSGEFRTAIAHSIREQVDVYVRSLALLGYRFDGADVLDEELRSVLLAPVSKIVRADVEVDNHTPKLMQLSELEILQLEKEREREARRKRRQTRGRRGVNLPDREPQKTHRTPAVHGIQSNDNVGADGPNTSSTADFVSGRRGDDHATGTTGRLSAFGGMSTRRAAAVMASANIASSIAADEYGTPTPQPEERNAPSAAISTVQVKESTKRRRFDAQATHFEYPGGLGNIDDDDADDEEKDRGPKFAVVSADAPAADQRSSELNRVNAAAAKAARHGLAANATSTPVAWNMARPEEALNQVANWHDGVWYCSNCGVPGTLDVSRRKGPLGDKSLCGMCGKYFHRHRKARPVEYTRSIHHHLKQLQSRGMTVDMVEVNALLNKERMAVSERWRAANKPKEETKPVSTEDAGAVSNESSTFVPAVSESQTSASNVSAQQQAVDVPVEDVVMSASMPSSQAAEFKAIPTSTPTPVPVPVPAPAPASAPASAPAPAGQTASALPVGMASIARQEIKTEEDTFVQANATSGNSPELPFEQVGSPDDSDSSGGEESSNRRHDGSQKALSPFKGGVQPDLTNNKTTPGRSESPFKSSSAAAAGHMHGSPISASAGVTLHASSSPITQSPPEWLTQASRALRRQYPLDRFEILLRQRPSGTNAPAIAEWRVRCQDCPGKLYTPGPDQTLNNFEIHLRNRVHRANVQKAAQVENRSAS